MDHDAEKTRTIKALEDGETAAEAVEGAVLGGDLDLTRPQDIPSELPVLPVRNVVVFPGTVVPLTIGRQKSRRLIDDVVAGNKLLAIFAQRSAEVEDPGIDDIYRIGTAAQVLKLLATPDGDTSLLVHGIVRVGLVDLVATEPYWRAFVEPHRDESGGSLEVEALEYNARRMAEDVIERSPNVPDEALHILRSIDKPGPLADFLAANLSLGLVQKEELLETLDVPERLRKVTATLQNQLEILKLAHKIQSDVRKEIGDSQRRYFLNEQLKAIQKELGEDQGTETRDLRERVEQARMPEAVLKEARRELDRLERLPSISPETGVIRDYIETLIEVPWSKHTEDNLDLKRAEAILNEDHYGLDKIKRRILEYLAVRKLNPDGKGPILCFAGPPGVGKTSLGQSIARALGRRFIRIALGGVRDEADIRGHRRTYIGAIPGRIIQEIRKAGMRNPVMMLDELDKLGRDFRGDPASALLEVLDPEQNHSFTDHYLGVPFDLSHAMFIGTANYMDPVEPALKDRMEVLDLPGYTTEEKLEIARRYLAPRQKQRNGLAEHPLKFPVDVLQRIIEGYTREAGVRNLERSIGTVCRGFAARVARGEKIADGVTFQHLSEFLGPARFEQERALATGIPGVVTGLAYTPTGGEIIFVEATVMPGRGNLTITGQVGDVMRESTQAALSLLRSRAKSWKIRAGDLARSDIHVHVPAGAVPKDGPSAGVAMLTALYTMLTQTVADPKVGMTGEITLRGQVLPIGGVKEKLIAAQRAGLETVIVPKRNEPDLYEVPESARRHLRFVFAELIEDVLMTAVPGLKLPRPEVSDAADFKAAKTRKPGGSKSRSRRGSARREKAANRATAQAALPRRAARKKPPIGGSRAAAPRRAGD